jgi:phosphatidylinositol glycan class N
MGNMRHSFAWAGAHGGGHPDETETPLLCWGAGVAGPRAALGASGSIAYTEFDGLLPKENRRDVSQADIAPLMVCHVQVHEKPSLFAQPG